MEGGVLIYEIRMGHITLSKAIRINGNSVEDGELERMGALDNLDFHPNYSELRCSAMRELFLYSRVACERCSQMPSKAL